MTTDTRQLQLSEHQKATKVSAAGFSSQGVALNVTTADGIERLLAFPMKEVPHLISMLADLAQQGTRSTGTLRQPKAGDHMAAPAPIECVAARAAPGQAQGEAMLIVHNGVFPLAFAIPADELRELAASIERVLPSAGTEPSSPSPDRIQ
jgi:hypothetical protein